MKRRFGRFFVNCLQLYESKPQLNIRLTKQKTCLIIDTINNIYYEAGIFYARTWYCRTHEEDHR